MNMNWISPVISNIPSGLMTPHILAYIDPGTGSIILQAVAAAVAGTAIAAKVYWHRILKIFGIDQNTHPDPSKNPAEKEE
jgi:hypothetical protein